jgi:hypothetical protein
MAPDPIKLECALKELEGQAKPNYLATASKYQLDRNTLKRRFEDTQCSMQESRSETTQRLTIAQ